MAASTQATAEPTVNDRRAGPSWTSEQVRDLSQSWGDPDWLRARRLAAWEQYQQMPMPTLRDEEWRKAQLNLIHWGELRSEPQSQVDPVSEAAELPAAFRALGSVEDGELAGLAVQQGAVEVYHALSEEAVRQGVLLMGLRRAVREASTLLQDHLFQKVTPELHKFTALHTALCSGGTVLYVPPGVKIEAPLVIGNWHAEEGGHASPHTLVILGAGSAATVVEAFQSPDFSGQTLATGASEIFVGDGAHLRYATIQEWGDSMMEVATRRVSIGRDATVQWTTMNLGARLVRNDLGALLEAPGGNAEMYGLALVSRRQHLDQHTLQEHQVGNTRSDLLFKVALRQRSRAVYRGVIRIHPDAQRSDAYQANRNLLLAPQAKVDTMPILEIEANDVRCTHGASLGKVDADQMFYLNSRGLSPSEAERLLVDGFFSEVVDRVPSEPLQQRTRDWIRHKLE